MRLLHVFSEGVTNPKHFFVGSTKDIRGRTQYFLDKKIKFDELILKDRSDNLLLTKLEGLNLDKYNAIFFEYPVYPKSILYCKQNYPKIRLLVRSHNAEFFHFLHYSQASLLVLKDIKLSLYYFIRSFERLWQNYQCAKWSDFILSISNWESDHYWKYLANKSKIITLPYYLPKIYEKLIAQKTKKKYQCVCLMSTTSGTLPFLLDAAKSFVELIQRLDNHYSNWEFFITGDFPKNIIELPQKIQVTGFLSNPYQILQESRCIALLSNYGFGFKSKIIDAISNDCYSLVTKKVFARIPKELQLYCIVVHPKSVNSFESALEKSLKPFPKGDPNDILKKKAYQLLDKLFF